MTAKASPDDTVMKLAAEVVGVNVLDKFDVVGAVVARLDMSGWSCRRSGHSSRSR